VKSVVLLEFGSSDAGLGWSVAIAWGGGLSHNRPCVVFRGFPACRNLAQKPGELGGLRPVATVSCTSGSPPAKIAETGLDAVFRGF
jgi:hypothetical protein